MTKRALSFCGLANGGATSPSSSSSFAATVVGGAHAVVAGPRGSDCAVRLSGGARVEVSAPAGACLADLALCADSGFTLRVTYRAATFAAADVFLVSSGSEVGGHAGVSVFLALGRVRVTVATGESAWYASFPPGDAAAGEWTTVDVSWSVAMGLAVYVDDALVTTQSVATTVTLDVTVATTVVIGASRLDGMTTSPTYELTVGTFVTYAATRPELVALGEMTLGT